MMRRDFSHFLQPRFLLIFFVATVIFFLAFSIFQREGDQADLVPEITHRVFLDVDVDAQRAGRIVIGLYGQVVPKTSENFRALCTGIKWSTERLKYDDIVASNIGGIAICARFHLASVAGEKGKGASGKELHYKGTLFHRIVSGFVIQGGDIVHGDGRGTDSIYGGTFPDENFKIKHSHAGVVSMVNTGPDSNGSQFFITTVKASWLDGEHVVFGKVIQGMDTVYAIEGGAGTYNGKPRKKVVIVDSGEIPRNKWDEEG